MSQENVETFRRMREPFNRRDVEAVLELLDPDVEWIPIMADLEGRVYRGHEEVRQWFEDLAVDWERFEVFNEKFYDLGDRVLTLGHWSARGRASGVELKHQAASWLTDFKGGRIVRLRTYTNRAEALEAVGLSEQDAHADS